MDIIFFRGAGRIDLRAVGAMTRVHTVATPPDLLAVGIRFRPGAGRAFLGLPLGEATDQSFRLDDLWGARGRHLESRLSDSASIPEMLETIESPLNPPEYPTPASRALLSLAAYGHLWSPDDLARQSGVSVRHFRRLCVDETGLTPKRLCRILRFRQTLGRIRSRNWNGGRIDFADLAAEGGFYDQAHLIREFRDLGGCTPSAVMRRRNP